jgi:two-component system, chemotaxis family, protein-glutamate methylesterase/glutaminase
MTAAPPRIAAVVIGASAGGIEALGVLLPALDRRCRAAVLIVVHVPRQRPSLLAEIFAARCALPVQEVEDKLPVQEGRVYFAPPDYHLLVDQQEDGMPSLCLSIDDPVHYSRPSIDVLFESAAECWGQRLLGVVLSGANEDGAAGIAAVARAGGLTIAQDPAEASSKALPLAAVRTGMVQKVLTLEAIAAVFGQLDCTP